MSARLVATPKNLEEAITLLMKIVEHLRGIEDDDNDVLDRLEKIETDTTDLESRVFMLEMDMPHCDD